MRYIYLHGFASSPSSRKAVAFREALELRGLELEVPALDGGDFEHMTLGSQLSLLEKALGDEPARLIGSSMGGYLAALYAATHPAVERLVLLAPAFRFAHRWRAIAGPDKMREWETSGWLALYHYGIKAPSRIWYELNTDALRYAAEPSFHQPALIFHGVQDETVPVEYSREFAATHSNAVLREMESDHELGNVLAEITAESIGFLTD